MDSPIKDHESMSEEPLSFDETEPEDPEAYILAVNDLFRIKGADSAEEAERILLDNIGEEPYLIYDVEVVDTES